MKKVSPDFFHRLSASTNCDLKIRFILRTQVSMLTGELDSESLP